MNRTDVTIFVCVSCRAPLDGESGEFHKPGAALADALAARLRETGASEIVVQPVDCLAVCDRPCTVAFAGENKWSYIVGGIDAELHAGDIVAAALSFGASENGIIPWKDRPLPFRKGVIARIPPKTYELPGDPV